MYKCSSFSQICAVQNHMRRIFYPDCAVFSLSSTLYRVQHFPSGPFIHLPLYSRHWIKSCIPSVTQGKPAKEVSTFMGQLRKVISSSKSCCPSHCKGREKTAVGGVLLVIAATILLIFSGKVKTELETLRPKRKSNSWVKASAALAWVLKEVWWWCCYTTSREHFPSYIIPDVLRHRWGTLPWEGVLPLLSYLFFLWLPYASSSWRTSGRFCPEGLWQILVSKIYSGMRYLYLLIPCHAVQGCLIKAVSQYSLAM